MTPREAFAAGRNVGFKVDGARVDIGLGTLTALIATAYRVNATRISGPEWMARQRFDIQAKIPEGRTKEQVPEMLQALLEERFKLVIHREEKEQQIYGLVLENGGLKLQPSAPEAGTSDKLFPHGDDGRKLLKIIHGTDGLQTVSFLKGKTMFETEKITLAGLAVFLQSYVDLPVIDMTGSKGTYQVAMDIPDRALAFRSVGRSPDELSAANASGLADDLSGGISIFASVKKLGLRLEKRKAPLEYLIIDHIEKVATEN